MKKTQEQKFLEVKEKLDYYRLPTIFPVEATDLLLKLLTLLPKFQSDDKENHHSKFNAPSNELNQALRLQINKVIKENNRLHSQIMSAQEQIQGLKFSIEKHQISKMGSRDEGALLAEYSRKRDHQLFEELTQVKFKYNQLMDLIHEDPSIERKYIKRLVKHKKLEISEPIPPSYLQRNSDQLRKIGQHEINADLEQKVKALLQKVANRESQILRLQKKLEYDGLNMNKILKDFENDRINTKVSMLEQNVAYLEKENKKMKEEVKNCRNKGGLKEALREQTRKNHAAIKQISDGNRSLKRKLKEKQYDQEARQKQIQRQIKKAVENCEKMESDYQVAQLTIKDLQKKIEFLSKELESTKNRLSREQDGNINKEILIDQMRNTQEGGKILYQYEIQNLKKRLSEMQEILGQNQNKLAKLINEKKFLEEEGLLKSEAIENLQKIVDQLMKREVPIKTKSELALEESISTNFDQAVLLKKQITQNRHLLALAKNQNMKIQQELENLRIRYDQKVRENAGFADEINKMKNKIYEIKRLENDQFDTDKIIEGLRLDIKKEQNLRHKVEAMLEDSQTELHLVKKQMKEITDQYEVFEKKAKVHNNELTTEKLELMENVQLLEIRVRDKDKKISLFQEKIEELQNKVNILRDQVNLLEDEKHSLIREKNRIEKRYDELQRSQEDNNGEDIKFMAINEHEVTRYKKQVAHLNERIIALQEQIAYCKSLNEDLRNEKQVVLSEKITILRENDVLKRENNELQRKIIAMKDI